MGKLSKFCSERISTPIDVLCSNFVKFGRREINFARLSSSRYCADRAQNLPQPAAENVLSSGFHPNTFGGAIAERVNTMKPSKRAVKCFQYSSEA